MAATGGSVKSVVPVGGCRGHECGAGAVWRGLGCVGGEVTIASWLSHRQLFVTIFLHRDGSNGLHQSSHLNQIYYLKNN